MKNIICGLLLLSIFFAACGDTQKDSCNAGYDQKVMLTNMADQVIIPSFKSLRKELNDVSERTNAFTTSPNQENLEALRADFKEAYIAWQKAVFASFGPAEEVQLAQKMNSFPVNAALLKANISFGNYDLDATGNYYSGFPALDYLLYMEDIDEAILAKYTTDEKAEGYKKYLKDVIALMLSKVNFVADKWEGSYRNTFVNNTGTAAGTGVSMLINALNENFENTRREKLGIPSGNHDVNVSAFPKRVEAYYSGMSKELLEESVKAARSFFNGASGEGFDDYLNYAKAKKDNKDLSKVINDQFELIISKLSGVDGNLSEAITNTPTKVQEVYTPLANQVVYLKTDMPTVLCVSITYLDNPSDSD